MSHVVGGGLVGDDVRPESPLEQERQHVRGVSDQADRGRTAHGQRALDSGERVVHRGEMLLEVASLATPLGTLGVDLDDERDRAEHVRCERLSAAHRAEAGAEEEPPLQRAAEVLPRAGGKRLVGALHDSLLADELPVARGVLAEHRQAARLEVVERLPGRPAPHELRVRHHDARARLGRAENRNRLA